MAFICMLMLDTLVLSVTVYVHEDPLPVEITSINQSVSGRVAEFTWQTLTELNNYGFDFERDGEIVLGSFVPGNGTTNVPHTYTYSDPMPSGRWFWYRLRQIDFNGTIWMSDSMKMTPLLREN